MASFAFWNINKRDLGFDVCRLVEERDLDFCILCESACDPDSVVAGLNLQDRGQYFHHPGKGENRFQIFSRFKNDFVGYQLEERRFVILNLKLPGIFPFRLMLVHANSLAVRSEKNIAAESVEMARILRDIEDSEGHLRTVAVGDFNENPFGDGLTAANGFHAIMDFQEAKRQGRPVDKKPYPYFYNPMWDLLGRRNQGAPGTYFYTERGMIELQWHTFDQVIVRPSLFDSFDLESVSIIAEIGGDSLLSKRGRPRKTTFSDHLPIYFEINAS